jgi:hypothetical protein
MRPLGQTDPLRFQYEAQMYRNSRPVVDCHETVCMEPPQRLSPLWVKAPVEALAVLEAEREETSVAAADTLRRGRILPAIG